MFKYLLNSILIVALFLILSCNKPLYKQKSVPIEKRVEDLLSRMTLQEKIAQISGLGFETRTNDRLDIPVLKMTDGPVGIRWQEATAFPAAVALASTWDKKLMYQVGKIMGIEARAHGRNFLLAPCVNIHRFPIGGRNFESYGEDPYLAGQLAVGFVKGVQDQGTLACVKHFVCNNQEWKRSSVNVKIDERTLREIYLPAFKTAVQEGGVWSVMSSYNKVNGHWTSENKHLLTDILKDEWGFKGFVVSDWGAVHSTAKTINARLDLEMPVGEFLNDSLVMIALKNGEATETQIDEMLRRLLRIRFKAGMFDDYANIDKSILSSDKHKQFALRTARNGIVLLKNEKNTLPININKLKNIAVIGPNANYARIGGGGSSKVTPYYAISPLEGLKERIGKDVNIQYAPGCVIKDDINIIGQEYFSCLEEGKRLNGLKGEYFKNNNLSGKSDMERIDQEINFFWCYDAPRFDFQDNDNAVFSIKWRGEINPPETGEYIFEIIHNDSVCLFINDQIFIEDKRGEGRRSTTASVNINLKKSEKYQIRLEYFNNSGQAEIKLGWKIPGQDLIKEAADLAKKSDVAVIFAGLSDHFESEGRDREFLVLENQDKLINEVMKVNPNTIVVLITGTPVLMNSWINKAPAVVQAWYGGQEGGNAIADVLLGDINPSGKLPCTFYKKLKDSPGFSDYKNHDLQSNYSEGLYIGYRNVDKNKLDVQFPFGHGLSYTRFEYSNMKMNHIDDYNYNVSVDIKNTGERTGTEVIQLYASDINSSVDRPIKELKGFNKVELNPGEKKTIQMKLDKSSFAYYDTDKNQWIVEPGDFGIMVGSSSKDIRLKEVLTLK